MPHTWGTPSRSKIPPIATGAGSSTTYTGPVEPPPPVALGEALLPREGRAEGVGGVGQRTQPDGAEVIPVVGPEPPQRRHAARLAPVTQAQPLDFGSCWSPSVSDSSSSTAVREESGSSTPSTAPATRWVVLLHGQLMPRRMHQPLARALASEGLHVVTLDLLGHGRSDRPADPLVYSMTAFAAPGRGAARPPRRRPGRHRRYVAGGQRLARGGGRGARAGARPDHRDARARQRPRGGAGGLRRRCCSPPGSRRSP